MLQFANLLQLRYWRTFFKQKKQDETRFIEYVVVFSEKSYGVVVIFLFP